MFRVVLHSEFPQLLEQTDGALDAFVSMVFDYILISSHINSIIIMDFKLVMWHPCRLRIMGASKEKGNAKGHIW